MKWRIAYLCGILLVVIMACAGLFIPQYLIDRQSQQREVLTKSIAHQIDMAQDVPEIERINRFSDVVTAWNSGGSSWNTEVPQLGDLSKDVAVDRVRQWILQLIEAEILSLEPTENNFFLESARFLVFTDGTERYGVWEIAHELHGCRFTVTVDAWTGNPLLVRIEQQNFMANAGLPEWLSWFSSLLGMSSEQVASTPKYGEMTLQWTDYGLAAISHWLNDDGATRIKGIEIKLLTTE